MRFACSGTFVLLGLLYSFSLCDCGSRLFALDTKLFVPANPLGHLNGAGRGRMCAQVSVEPGESQHTFVRRAGFVKCVDSPRFIMFGCAQAYPDQKKTFFERNKRVKSRGTDQRRIPSNRKRRNETRISSSKQKQKPMYPGLSTREWLLHSKNLTQTGKNATQTDKTN